MTGATHALSPTRRLALKIDFDILFWLCYTVQAFRFPLCHMNYPCYEFNSLNLVSAQFSVRTAG